MLRNKSTINPIKIILLFSIVMMLPLNLSAQVNCGDMDNNPGIDIGDLVWMVEYQFNFGPLPIPDLCVSDIDGVAGVDIGDIVWMVEYQFGTGDPPVPGCCIAYYPDNDGDGYGDNSTPVYGTSPPSGYIDNNLDCDDSDPNINPGVPETTCDGLDNDCNAATFDYVDADLDGVTNCADCDDNNPNVYPGNIETTCDGLDNDCNQNTPDEIDADQDGVSACSDCDDSNPNVYPGNNETTCDGLDNDCNAATPDEIDADLDGVTSCIDCDDNNPNVYPGNIETTCDGLDNDCNVGTPDAPDNDGDGVSVCADCDDNNPNNFPGNQEICDGIDNNCNYFIDQAEVPISVMCGSPSHAVVNCGGPAGCFISSCDNRWYDCDGVYANGCEVYDADGDGYPTCAGDCDDNNPNIHPGATDICDGINNDCDAYTDEDANCSLPQAYSTCGGSQGCIVTSCQSGWANCDGINSNGCETLLNTNPSCGSYIYLGSMSGDGCGSPSTYNYYSKGEKYMRMYFREDCSGLFTNDDLNVRFRLYVPSGVDYDLHIYNDACGLLGSSRAGGSATEEVTIRWNDVMASDDSRYLRIEVSYWTGSSCSDWQLNMYGYATEANPVPGDTTTESTIKVIKENNIPKEGVDPDTEFEN